ncbi:MAG: hypothetical protein IT457_03590 [Planctomycetes bacterium]|nr:hypothetical protein [Planctomycetota bacterium]
MSVDHRRPHPVLPLLLSLAGAAAMSAQDPAPKPPSPEARDYQALLEPVFDRAQDGAILVAAETYKAEFDRGGARFIPFLGSDAPRNLPLAFVLRHARVSDRELELDSPKPSRHGDTIEFARGACVEQYLVRAEVIEQRFVFTALPARGALELVVDVESEFDARTTPAGIRFTHALGSVGYGRALAIDAKGERLELDTRWDGHAIRIEVPKTYVERAALPLLVDPAIGTISSTSSTRITRSVDLAWDSSLATWLAVWERVFSATDSDIFARPLDAALLGGTTLTIDSSTASLRDCRVGGLQHFDRFLVVASRKGSGTDEWIVGRIVQGGPSFSVGAEFDIERSGPNTVWSGNNLRPDVAGDTANGSPNFWTIVWENDSGLGSRRVICRQLRQDGWFHVAGPLQLSVVGEDATRPAILEATESSVRNFDYLVAYHSQVGAVTRLKTVMGTDGNASYFGRHDLGAVPAEGACAVSMPIPGSAGPGHTLLVFEVAGVAGLDIHGALLATDGSLVVPPTNLTALEGLDAAHLARDQRRPRVSTDRHRFAVAYQNDWNAGDPDIRAMTVAVLRSGGSTSLVVQDSALVASSTDSETAPAIAYAVNGADAARCAVLWNQSSASGFAVQGRLYDALRATGGVVTRATGCGGLTITASGVPAIGYPLSIALTNRSGLGGFFIGLPVSIALAGCNPCVLGADGAVIQLAATTLQVPSDAALVGGTVAIQGFDTGNPACLGLVRLSDTLDVTLR